jgi:hypothetical protein
MNILCKSGLLAFTLLILFSAIGYSQEPSTDPQQAAPSIEHLQQQINNLQNQLNRLRAPIPSPWTPGRS